MLHRRRAVGLLLPVFLLAGCAGGDEADQAGQDGVAEGESTATAETVLEETSGSCAATDAELVDAGTKPGEPTLRVPLPEGWERDTSFESESVRLALANPGLTRESFAPNLVVTAEPSPADADAAIGLQLSGIADLTGLPDIPRTPGEICGHPSVTTEYILPAQAKVPERPAIVQIIVIPHGSETLTYTMTAQATAPTDPAYEQDVAAMLQGVQLTD